MVLAEILNNLNKFAIAFSGGVDSVFLAASAKQVCSKNVIAITADSQFQAREDLDNAVRAAKVIGIEHIIIKIDIIKDLNIINNTKERCYFCKKTLFSALKKHSLELGFDILAHGANIDDLQDYRPGLKAAKELDIISPLVKAEMSKSEIRKASKDIGLFTWNMPSQSCLATRIPYGDLITIEKLSRVEICERFLHELGFYGIRVRHHTDAAGNIIAEIEAPSQFLSQIIENEIRNKIIDFFKSKGFNFTTFCISEQPNPGT